MTAPVSLAEPVTLKQPVQMKTADTDPVQFVTGNPVYLFYNSGTKIVDGPLILTDLAISTTFNPSGTSSSFISEIYIDDPACQMAYSSPAPTQIAVLRLSADRETEIHGARLLIPAGKAACGRKIEWSTYGVTLIWSGFRPYQ